MPTAFPLDRLVHTEPVMGTVVSFDIRDRSAGVHLAIQEAVDDLHEVDAVFSTYRESSVIRRLSRGALAIEEAPSEVRWVLRRCEELRRETAGYFDAAADGALDPSALVKGWALGRAARILEARGLRDFCITGGGDVVCRGDAAPETGWRIGVQHPLDSASTAAVVTGSGLAVATSGSYERGQHILDPHRRHPAHGLLSVTVTGPDLALADAYSTAVFAMGPFGAEWSRGLPARGYEALLITADEIVVRTPGFLLTEDPA